MIPIEFKKQNLVYVAPNCGDLPVHKGIMPDGTPCIISKWRLSDEDMCLIQATGCIYLSISANDMPPVFLCTENPFEDI